MRLTRSRLFEPGLNCANCYTLFSKNGKRPACMAKRCGIADVAPDVALNRKVNAFLQAESLELSPGYAMFQERLLRESGLADETAETVLAMKAEVARHREYESKRKG